MPPWNESSEAMLMILPRRRSSIGRAKACDRKNTDLRLVSITASQSASLKSMASARRMMPALFTRMSTAPFQAIAPSVMRWWSEVVERSASIAMASRPSPSMPAMVRDGSLRPTSTRSAPAEARASAIACPRPVLAPVTTATLPSSPKEGADGLTAGPPWRRSPCREILVVAGHGPDEAVVGRAAAGMDRPARRDHCLLVGHDDVPCLLRLAHEVEDAGLRGEIEVKIDLGAAIMNMRGHRVPDAAGLEPRDPHHQLAGGADVGVDVLPDRAEIGRCGRSEIDALRLGFADADRGMRGVGRCRQEVEAGWIGGVVRAERHLARAAAHIERVAAAESMALAGDRDRARAADVDDPEFAPVEERGPCRSASARSARDHPPAASRRRPRSGRHGCRSG